MMTHWESNLPIRLSICIPTYNRSECLRELLASIEQQQRPGLQVVVGDDASPDDTRDIIKHFLGRINNLCHFTHASNVGLDQNYQAVARAAAGDFVWMMGDDDRIEPGGVANVFELLDQWPNVVGLTLGVLDYDSELRQPTGLRKMPKAQLTHGVAELFSLIPEHLGFMSALVICRASWLRVVANDPVNQFQNLYSQVYVIGRAVGRDGAWGVTPKVCVAFRSNNDQFEKRMGWYRRLETDVLAYGAIADSLLFDNAGARRVMKARILDSHVLARLRNGKLAGLSRIDMQQASILIRQQFSRHIRCWTTALPTLYAPAFILRCSKSLHQRFNPTSGRFRARVVVTGAETTKQAEKTLDK